MNQSVLIKLGFDSFKSNESKIILDLVIDAEFLIYKTFKFNMTNNNSNSVVITDSGIKYVKYNIKLIKNYCIIIEFFNTNIRLRFQ